MKNTVMCAAVLFCLPFVVSASVEVSEIAWMGTADSSANEWIELYSTDGADLTGWKLETADGGLTIALSGSIVTGGYYLIERTDDTTVPTVSADLIAPFGSGLSNTGETLLLKDALGNVVEEVSASSGWPAGDNETKETMQRSGASWVTAAATPKSQTTASADQPQDTTEDSDTASQTETKTADTGLSRQTYIPPEKLPHIKAFAGDDQRVVAGEELRMDGHALGLENEPLPEARYLWNFGNSIVKEGRRVVYIYPFPGTYTVRLTISSGEYAAFDDAMVRVAKNSVWINEASPGIGGWVELQNKGKESVNLSGWILGGGSEDKKFVLPQGTRIAPESFIVLENAATKIALTNVLGAIMLYYPNGVEADKMVYDLAVPQGASVARIESSVMLTKPTPGEANGRVPQKSLVGGASLGITSATKTQVGSRVESAVLDREESVPSAGTPPSDDIQQKKLAEYQAATVLPGSFQGQMLQSNWFWLIVSALFGVVAGWGLVVVRRKFSQLS